MRRRDGIAVSRRSFSPTEVLDIVATAAFLKVAETQCRNLRDYFRLIQRTSGFFRNRNLAPTQKEIEIVTFLRAASKLPIESALEIGTGNGGTFYLLCKAAKSNANLLTVDLQNDWKKAVLFASYSKPGQKIHIIRGNSRDEKTLSRVMRALGPRRLDLLYIDGDHSLVGVRKDFELYSRLMRPQGMVAMHDIIPDYRTRYGVVTSSHTGDVPRFWNLIKSKWKSQEFVESHDQDGYGIGMICWDAYVRLDDPAR